jgi:hypothetical protein
VLGLMLCIPAFAQAQTLEETTHWLHSFVAAKAVVHDRSGIWSDTYTVEFRGAQITIIHGVKDQSCLKPENRTVCGDAHVSSHFFKQQFSLKEIDPDSIQYEENLNFRGYTIPMNTTNLSDVIVYSVRIGNDWVIDKARGVEEDHKAYIVVQDEQSAKRIVKALRHAVLLSGGKPSPF